jgi:type II secretory pathway pseudopilin PulG
MNMKKMCKFRNRAAGMTLVELVTGIIILGVLAAIGIPGILGSIQRTGVDGASRRLTEDIRRAQSNALTRGVQARLIVFDQTGVVPTTPTAINDTTKANMYRIEIRSGASASWPALTDTPGSNSNVLTVWNDLGAQYHGVAVTTGNAVIFNSLGGLLNATLPASIVVQGSGGTRSVQTNVIGKATIL